MSFGKAIKASESRVWLCAVFLAVVFQGVWWVALAPADVPVRSEVLAQPNFCFMPILSDSSEDGSRQEAIRSVWSPIVFSLPTAQGFSKSLWSAADGLKPPLETVDNDDLYLARVRTQAPRSAVCAIPSLTSLVAQVQEDLAVARPMISTSMDRLPRASSGPMIDFLDGFVKGEIKAPISLLDQGLLASDWEVLAHIDIDAQGQVEHVFLEELAKEDAVNTALLQSLYQWQLLYPGTPRSGKVRLRSTQGGGG